MKKQKSYYKSLILTSIGFPLWIIGFICAFICGIYLDNIIILVPINIALSLIGLIIFIIDDNWSTIFSQRHPLPTLFYKYHYYGTPNNNYKEFEIKTKDILQEKEIKIIEEEKGVFKTIINGKDLLFNLCGWHNKSYCLYEYFMSVLQSELSNHNYKKSIKSISIKDISSLIILIRLKNGKLKKCCLIKNNRTNITLKFKMRLEIKHDCLNLYNINIKKLCDFNM